MRPDSKSMLVCGVTISNASDMSPASMKILKEIDERTRDLVRPEPMPFMKFTTISQPDGVSKEEHDLYVSILEFAMRTENIIGNVTHTYRSRGLDMHGDDTTRYVLNTERAGRFTGKAFRTDRQRSIFSQYAYEYINLNNAYVDLRMQFDARPELIDILCKLPYAKRNKECTRKMTVIANDKEVLIREYTNWVNAQNDAVKCVREREFKLYLDTPYTIDMDTDVVAVDVTDKD